MEMKATGPRVPIISLLAFGSPAWRWASVLHVPKTQGTEPTPVDEPRSTVHSTVGGSDLLLPGVYLCFLPMAFALQYDSRFSLSMGSPLSSCYGFTKESKAFGCRFWTLGGSVRPAVSCPH